MPILSIQLYSLRNSGTLAEQLDIAHQAGFRAVETIGSMLGDARGLRDLLDARGMTAPSGHVSMPDMRERFGDAVAAAKTVGIETLVVPAFHPPLRPTDAEGWRAIGAELGDMAGRLADAGLRLGFHNHHWEVERLPDGTLPLDLLLDAAGPAGVLWEADLAWLVRGADDPAARIARHRDRLFAVHVKDIAPAGEKADEDGWADPGDGTLPWETYWGLVGNVPLMIAEHDKPSDGARFARRAFATMSRLAREAAL
jgi:sugar phosphate isomerase/epimerase